VGLWVGDSLRGGIFLSVLIASGFLLHSINHVGQIVLTVVGQVKTLAAISWLEAILNISLSILFVWYFGLIGVAMGTVIGSILASAWLVPLIMCKTVKLPISEFFRRGIFPTVAVLPASIVLATVCQMWLRDFRGEKVWLLFWIGLFTALIYGLHFILCFAVTLHEKERSRLKYLFFDMLSLRSLKL
jgi:O-antigen/teichoic acid export membrane protein